jgi:S1-C subfamily serine protease
MTSPRPRCTQLAALLALLVLLALTGCGGSSPQADTQAATGEEQLTTAAASTTATASTTEPSKTAATTAAVVERRELVDTIAEVRSGVVRINVRGCDGSGSGTGIIISPTLVVTVEHVIAGAARITLERSRNILGQAEVIGLDRDRDLALLRLRKPISGYRFRFAERPPRLGEEVAALGYPFGLPLSVSRGTVSGLSRTIAIDGIKRRALVQTDAAVNPGNSGGPLLAVRTGEVVGLVDLGTTEANGIAFAVSGVVANALVNAWRNAPQPHPLEKCPAPEVAPAPGRQSVGVPARYAGHFTSVDRLQRCYADNTAVYCSSGPSGDAVELEAGGAVVDLSPSASRDEGGPSMPMGTTFTTPGETIRCESSRRGITCIDLLDGGAFTIGDHQLIIDE